MGRQLDICDKEKVREGQTAGLGTGARARAAGIGKSQMTTKDEERTYCT